MIRKCFSATVAAALCLASLTPAAAVAQEYRFAGFDAPRGASATLNLRMPLGSESRRHRPTFGVTAAFGQEADLSVLGQSRTRAVRIGDLRFDSAGLNSARLLGVDLANLDQYRRLGITDADGNKKSIVLIIGAIVLGGVILCVVEICDDDGNSSGNSN